jgi:hypothetical protein
MLTFTHPGKFGDLLWALATVKALGGGRLWLPDALQSIGPLLLAQPYIHGVYFDPTWQVQDTAPATPRTPRPDTDGPPWDVTDLVHLGYPGWPDRPLPEYTAALAGVVVDLGQPWIATPTYSGHTTVDVLGHFTDRWFELKYGCWQLLTERLDACTFALAYAPDSRWLSEGTEHVNVRERAPDWLQLARLIPRAKLVLCDNSAAMVLCAAFQTTPCLVLEPEEARHHPIFWPGIQGGDDGPERWRPREPLCRWIHPLLGGDGRPTFDSRHLIATVRRLLDERLGMEADRG